MKKTLLVLLVLAACGGGSDDKAEDNRICVVTDSFNDNSDHSTIEEQASEAGLTTRSEGLQISLCGASTDIDTAISNAGAPELSEALATGTKQDE